MTCPLDAAHGEIEDWYDAHPDEGMASIRIERGVGVLTLRNMEFSPREMDGIGGIVRAHNLQWGILGTYNEECEIEIREREASHDR